jgi:hypothetical protein
LLLRRSKIKCCQRVFFTLRNSYSTEEDSHLANLSFKYFTLLGRGEIEDGARAFVEHVGAQAVGAQQLHAVLESDAVGEQMIIFVLRFRELLVHPAQREIAHAAVHKVKRKVHKQPETQQGCELL